MKKSIFGMSDIFLSISVFGRIPKPIVFLCNVAKNQPKPIMSRIFLKLSMLLFLSAIVSLSYGQNTELRGVVYDDARSPVPGAEITLNPKGEKTRTNLDGEFLFQVATGEYTLVCAFPGFKTLTKNVAVNGNTKVEFVFEAASEELELVVISAGKFEQNIGEVTVSMEVIKPRLLQEKNAVSIDEILQQTPGVSIVDGEPQIRSGSGYSFGAGSRVQVLVDNLPMLSGDAGKPTWEFLPIENLSQVEIIKGASSVLYGSSALSGVVNMQTSFPGEKPETQVTVFHGVFSNPQTDSAVYWNGNLMRTGVNFLHKRKIGQLDLVVGGYLLGDDGHLGPIRDTATGNIVNGYNPFTSDRYASDTRGRVNVNLGYNFKNIPGLSAGIRTNWSKSNSLGTFIWQNTNEGLYDAYAGSATRTQQLLGTVDPYITYTGKKGAKHALRSRWQTLDNENDNNQGNFSDVLYTEYQYQQNWSDYGLKGLNTTMGVVNMTTTSRGELYLGGNEDGENYSLNQAAFLQADLKIKERLNVSGGVRYEQFTINGEKEGKPVFRAGANFKLMKATYVRASYGEGYRFPSIAEKFIVTALGALQIYANPELESETSYNAEFGIKQGFKFGKVQGFIDVALFQQEFENYIEFTFGQWAEPRIDNLLGFGFKSINTGKARVRGAELSILGEGKVGPVLLQFLTGYTYTLPTSLTPDFIYGRSRNVAQTPVTFASTSSDPSDNILKYRMLHLVRGDIQGTFRKYALGASVRYNSNMVNIDNAFEFLETNVPEVFNPGIVDWRNENNRGDYVVDARLSYKVNEHHKVALIVNNLLNREYAIRPLSIEEPRLTTIQYTFNW
jgi:iron complex outermembrane receptor protein